MKNFRPLILVMILALLAGCATCRQQPNKQSSSTKQTESEHGWQAQLLDQVLENVLRNLVMHPW
jgi:outer membrane biogenesis lipoprotein LolB